MGEQVLTSFEAGRRRRKTQAEGEPQASDVVRRSTRRVLCSGASALSVCVFFTLLESRRLGIPAPFEDAAMLFKYAENLAHGWGITWNAGQPPGLTDGATDLGFVLALAPFTLLGLSTAAAAVLLNLSAVFGIGLLLGVLNEKVWRRPLWLPMALSALVGAGPVSRYVLSGFSPPVMGFLLLGAFTLAVIAPLAHSDRGSLTLLASAGATAAITGWWRPEGFVFGPLVVLFGLALSWHAVRQRLLSAAAAGALLLPFAVLVLAWVGFRIDYFGQLLPTSAVMKSGSLQLANNVYSLQFYGSLLLPLVGVRVALMLGAGKIRNWWLSTALLAASLLWVNAALPQDFWDRIGLPVMVTVADVATAVVFVPLLAAIAVVGIRRRDGSWIFPAAVFTFSLAWVAVTTILDWWGRMQWPLVPVLVALAATCGPASRTVEPAAPRHEDPVHGRRVLIAVLATLTCIGVVPFHLPIGGYFESPFQTNVAAALRAVDTSHVRLATTEAGLIPLAVTGPVLDTEGYNNRSIASSHGATLTQELDAFHPNVVAIHGLPPDIIHLADCPPARQHGPTKFAASWSTMVSTVVQDVQRNGLTLTRISETTPCETWSLWLANDVEPRVRQAVEQLTMPGTDIDVADSRPAG